MMVGDVSTILFENNQQQRNVFEKAKLAKDHR
jgi:hypothetical protein